MNFVCSCGPVSKAIEKVKDDGRFEYGQLVYVNNWHSFLTGWLHY